MEIPGVDGHGNAPAFAIPSGPLGFQIQQARTLLATLVSLAEEADNHAQGVPTPHLVAGSPVPTQTGTPPALGAQAAAQAATPEGPKGDGEESGTEDDDMGDREAANQQKRATDVAAEVEAALAAGHKISDDLQKMAKKPKKGS